MPRKIKAVEIPAEPEKEETREDIVAAIDADEIKEIVEKEEAAVKQKPAKAKTKRATVKTPDELVPPDKELIDISEFVEEESIQEEEDVVVEEEPIQEEEAEEEPVQEEEPNKRTRLIEQVPCEECGKLMTNKTLKYSHRATCKAKKVIKKNKGPGEVRSVVEAVDPLVRSRLERQQKRSAKMARLASRIA